MQAFAKPPERAAVPDEPALVARARAGDADALDTLLRHYQGPLLRFSMRMCGGDEEDARDVLQESLLSAARHLDAFRGDAKLSTWLFTIARRFCGKRRRRSKFAPSEVSPLSTVEPVLAHPGPAPEDAMASREVMRALERAIAMLEPTNREVLVLRDVEGLSAREVAEVVGMTQAQVKSRLHRARVAIRAEMTEALEPAAAAASLSSDASACPDIARAFSRFLEDDIDTHMCAELQQHVDGCPRCQQACDGIKRTLAVCRAVPEPTVPPEVQRAIRDALRAEFK